MNRLTLILLGSAAREAVGFAPRSDLNAQGTPHQSNRLGCREVQLNYLPKNYNDDTPPFSEAETPKARARRMELARELQRSFYKDPSTSSSSALVIPQTTNPNTQVGSTVLRNLPTLTTYDGINRADESALLPGHQFVWNIHNPQHCHMFHSILSGPAPWYFAHVYLPGAPSASDPKENEGEIQIDNVQAYKEMQSQIKSNGPIYGTLLRITDRRFQDEDGRIVLAVQAIDRIRVHNVASVPGAGLSTDVQLSPEEELMRMYFDKALMSSASYLSSHCDSTSSDDEYCEALSCPSAVSGAARAAAAADTSRVRRFEYLPIFLEEKPRRPSSASSLRAKSTDSNATKRIEDAIRKQDREKEEAGPEYVSVVQLCNYDAFEFSSLGNANAVTSQALKTYWEQLAKEATRDETSVAAEEDLFGGHDRTSSQSFFLPEPTVPSDRRPASLETVEVMEYHVWLKLDEMIRLLSLAATATVPLPSQLLGLMPKRSWPREYTLDDYAKSLATSGSTIGTAFKSPFVRVDQVSASNSSAYSPLRRAQRLSYAIWLLLDGLAMTGTQPKPPPRHVLLEMNSIEERLSAAKETLDGLNAVLKKMVSDNKGEDHY